MERPVSRRGFLRAASGAAALAVEAAGAEAAPTTPLPQRPLGKTGIRVPILGFGTAPTGIRRNVANAVALYHEAIDSGVTYMDTAPSHTGYGNSQVQLGHVLKERRKEVFLVTKCHEAGGDAALRLLARNLKELQTDHADLVHVHSLGDLDLASAMGRNGIFRALLKAKKEGLTRFVGVSGHNRPAKFLRALEEFDIDVLMNAVNFADRYTYGFEEKVWPAAARKKVGLVAMKVFGGMKYHEQTMTNSQLPAEHLDMAFRYALSLPNVACAVIGMGTREELRQNLARARAFKPLSEEERADLAAVGRRLAKQLGPHYGPVS
jgi:uncharacterized protein